MENKDKAFEVAFLKSITPKAIISKEGYFLAVNQQYCNLLEYSELELFRRRFQELTDPDDVEADAAEAQRIVDGKIESYEMIKSYITKTKHLIRVRLRVDAVRDEDNTFLCFVAQATPFLNMNLQSTRSVGEFRGIRILSWLDKNSKWLLWILTAIGVLIGTAIRFFFETK